MYFLRLTRIKPAVDEVAAAAWDGTVIGGEEAKRVDRVLDVRQGELCWVTGTVYMDMSLKPNILEDVSKDVRPFLPGRLGSTDTKLALDLGPDLEPEVLLRGRFGPDDAGRRLGTNSTSRRPAQDRSPRHRLYCRCDGLREQQR